MNIYHQNYAVGDYVKLIQFCYDRYDGRLLYLRIEELLRLIRKRKINCRYVKVNKVVMRIAECVDHGRYRQGYVGVMESADTMLFQIGHNQYPDYVQGLEEKFLWRVYKINLGVKGSYSEQVYEEHDRVLRLIANKYVPIHLREAIDPEGRGVQSLEKRRLHPQSWR